MSASSGQCSSQQGLDVDQTPLQGRRSVTVNAAERQLWYPGGEAPKHLDGSLPGDYGSVSTAEPSRQTATGR